MSTTHWGVLFAATMIPMVEQKGVRFIPHLEGFRYCNGGALSREAAYDIPEFNGDPVRRIHFHDYNLTFTFSDYPATRGHSDDKKVRIFLVSSSALGVISFENNVYSSDHVCITTCRLKLT